jgi:hypothetical protein
MRINLSDCVSLLITLVVGVLATLQCYSWQQSSLIMSASNKPTNPPDSSLSAWFKARIERLHNVSEESDLQAQLRDIFTDNARIVLNHKPVSVDEFNRELANRRFAVVGETLNWQHIVDAIEDDAGGDGPRPDNEIGGTVAGSYVVTRSLKFQIRAAPAQRKCHVVFSAMCVFVGFMRRVALMIPVGWKRIQSK